jgi:hypothetical protein
MTWEQRKRTASRTGIQAQVKLALLRGQPLPCRGLQQALIMMTSEPAWNVDA